MLTTIIPPGTTRSRLALSAAGFIAIRTSAASPPDKTGADPRCTWKPDTPAIVPAGALISAG